MPWFIHIHVSNRGHLKYMFLILLFGAMYQIIISMKREKIKILSSYLHAARLLTRDVAIRWHKFTISWRQDINRLDIDQDTQYVYSIHRHQKWLFEIIYQ